MKKNLVKKWLAFVLVFTMLAGNWANVALATRLDAGNITAMLDASDNATTLDIGDIENETNGKTFTLRRDYYELLTNHPLYGTKDYIAYQWEDHFSIWFFNDDLTNVKFSMWNRGSENFGLYPSENVTFTDYVYDSDTLELISTGNHNIDGSNAYNFGYDFISSFNIYTDKTYSTYFYEVKDSVGNIEFKPLEPEEAKDFLKFIVHAGLLVNIEKELPEYYNFLIGEIQDPEEELRTKVSFLTFLYYCLDAQLAQVNERVDLGTTYLINWIGGNTEISNIIYSEVQDSIVDNLRKTIGANATIPGMALGGVSIVTAIIDYADVFIVSLGSIDKIQTRDEIQYLLAYKHLLEAKATNDEVGVIYAESICDSIIAYGSFGGDFKKMQRFAGYLFNIEQSLPV